MSVSVRATALAGYVKKEEEELTIVKDDSLRVFREYKGWSYASLVVNRRCYLPSLHDRLSKKKQVIAVGFL